MLVGLGGVIGVVFTAWGLWLFYAGIADVDPQSETPRWFAFVLGGGVLLVGAWLLLLVRSARRKQRTDAQR
jgi:hypothetical protein